MRADDLALVQGIGDTRATLRRWNLDPFPVLRGWVLGALGIALLLLLAVFVVSKLAVPDPRGYTFAGLTRPAREGDVVVILQRNALVLALHAFACIAGYIAGSSLPAEAERYSGVWRAIHDKAGPLAILFVSAATAFSLLTQALVLGNAAAGLAAQGGIGSGLLLLGLLPHALLELTALFLPLAAWVIASRAGRWNELLAATFVTTVLAVPVVVAMAYVEVYVSPDVILWLRDLALS